MNTWTLEDFYKARAMWLRGISAKNISTAFGGKYSRNSIISKMNRSGVKSPLGPGGNNNPEGTNKTKKADEQPKRRHYTRRKRMPSTSTHSPPSLPPKLDVKPSGPPRRLTLEELEPHHCRWPYGGTRQTPAFTFCARDTSPADRYCSFHERLTIAEWRR